MEWFGILAFIMRLCQSAYPGKVKRVEAAVNRLERKQKERALCQS